MVTRSSPCYRGTQSRNLQRSPDVYTFPFFFPLSADSKIKRQPALHRETAEREEREYQNRAACSAKRRTTSTSKGFKASDRGENSAGGAARAQFFQLHRTRSKDERVRHRNSWEGW